MKRLALPALALLALLAASCGPRDVQQPGVLIGRWYGRISWRDATTPVMLDVLRSGDSLSAMFSAPALGVDSLPLGRLAYDPPRVHFVVHDVAGRFVFDGWLRRGLVVGSLASPSFGNETNPSRLPQVSLQQRPANRKKLPFPAAAQVDSVPPPERLPQHSLGAWLLSRLVR
jgi:hypothetical protein